MTPDDSDAEFDDQISKSQLKRDADEIRTFAIRLVNEPTQRLKRLPLSDPLREAIASCPPPSTRGAYKRHTQFIAKLIRKAGNFDELQQLLLDPPAKPNPHREFCEQLIASFTDNADKLRQQYPQVSLQQARQLATAAAKVTAVQDEPDEKQKRANKKADQAKQALLRLLTDNAN